MSGAARPRRRRAVAEVSAGGVVYRRGPNGTRFLLIRDPYGNWGLPKGHVEEHDPSLEDAARREVSEETGLPEPRIVRALPTIDWYFRSGGRLIHKTCHFYLMESATGEAVPQAAEGITACTWEYAEDALATITYDNARAVLEAATKLVRELHAA
ncbi:MAG TPA: NUDIX hydrolase [Longimicrobiales bacterium]|nr:NUDIX hydrolase [Longimicrobiales bacterium]